MTVLRFLPLVSIALAGCASQAVEPPKPDASSSTAPSTSAPAPPIDTAAADPFVARILTMSLLFGYDHHAGLLQGVTLATGVQAPEFIIRLGQAGWNGNLSFTEQYCQVVFELAPTSVRSPNPSTIEISQLDPDLAWTDCDLEPGFITDAMPELAAPGWTFTFGGPVHPDLVGVLPIASQHWGGIVDGTPMLDAVPVLGKGWEVEVDFSIALGDDGIRIPIQKSAAFGGPGLQSGYYEILVPYYWSF